MERREKREYERPRTAVVQLRHRRMLLLGSERSVAGINPMENPEDI